MNTTTEQLTNSFLHRYAGNGWIVIENYEDDWCRVANFFRDRTGNWKIGSQCFLVWSKLLSVEAPIHRDLVDEINGIRDKLKSGEYVVKNTRLEKAKA